MTLTKIQETRRNILEREIADGLEESRRGQLKAAAALTEIRDQKLFSSTHASFKEYVEDVWKITEQHAYRLVQATEVVQSLAPGTQHLVTNEHQARVLATLPKSQRGRVLREVARTGPITGARINEAIQATGGTVAPTIQDATEVDRTGMEIPDTILEDWHRAEDLSQKLLSQLSDIKVTLAKGMGEERDVLFGELSQTEIASAQNLISNVKRLKPHAVCPTCSGITRAKCTLCKKRGFISKFAWDTVVPAEQKVIREKRNAKNSK
jgi:hypothetical protein